MNDSESKPFHSTKRSMNLVTLKIVVPRLAPVFWIVNRALVTLEPSDVSDSCRSIEYDFSQTSTLHLPVPPSRRQ